MRIDSGTRTVALSRTNLRSLLAKLDGHPANSLCTLLKDDEATGLMWMVTAQEDDEHYRGRNRGVMHDETEAAL